jgi:hypothetical protein
MHLGHWLTNLISVFLDEMDEFAPKPRRRRWITAVVFAESLEERCVLTEENWNFNAAGPSTISAGSSLTVFGYANPTHIEGQGGGQTADTIATFQYDLGADGSVDATGGNTATFGWDTLVSHGYAAGSTVSVLVRALHTNGTQIGMGRLPH